MKSLLPLLAIVLALLLGSGAYIWGFEQGSRGCSKESIMERAQAFANGHITLCELDEDALVAVCPSFRMFLPIASGTGAFVYQCMPEDIYSYMRLVGVDAQAEERLLGSLRLRGLQPQFHCRRKDGAPVYRVFGGRLAAR